MPDPVELNVRSELSKVVEELQRINAKSKEVSAALKSLGDNVSKNVKDKTKETETFLSKLRSFTGRVADEMGRDLKAALSLGALKETMSFSKNFRQAVTDTMTLTDTIRKLGASLGVSTRDFVSFQNKLQRGLGEIGLSAQAGANALQGLAETPVRGTEALLEYSRTAGRLARVSMQGGREGDIAKGLSGVIQARGGNVSDLGQMNEVAQSVLKIRNATNKSATEALDTMTEMFQSMPSDLKKSVKPGTLAQIAAAGLAAGPGSTKFLSELLKNSPVMRERFAAQGFSNVVGSSGINMQQLQKALPAILARVHGDKELAAGTLGLGDEAGRGMVMFMQKFSEANEAIEKVKNSSADLTKQDMESLTLMESFNANLARATSAISEFTATLQNQLTDFLTGTSGSASGSAAVSGGAGLLTAILGVKSAGALAARFGVGGAAAEGAAAIPMAPLTAVGAGVAGHYYLGGKIAGDTPENQSAYYAGGSGLQGDVAYLLKKLIDKLSDGNKVKVELNRRELKESRQPTRGASFEP